MFLLLAGLALASPEVAVGLHADGLSHPAVVGRGTTPALAWRRATAQLEVQGGLLWHPGLMTALHARGGPAARVTGPRGGTWGWFAHVGVEHGFWTAPTYAAAGGAAVRRPLSGDTWAVFATGPELGRAIDRGFAAGWTLRPTLGLRAPTFHGVGIDAGIELGLRLRGRS